MTGRAGTGGIGGTVRTRPCATRRVPCRRTAGSTASAEPGPGGDTHDQLRDAALVIEPDPSAPVRFEVRARNEYWDLKPYLDEYRRTPGASR